MLTFQVPGDLALTSDGRDLLLGRGAPQVAQAIRRGLENVLGSWRYDTSTGFSLLDIDLPPVTYNALLRQEFLALCADIPGVRNVDALEVVFDRSAGTANIRFRITATDGDTIADNLTYSVVS